MQITKIKAEYAWVKSGSLLRQINIQMLPKAKVGDFVIVHAGFAIEILDPAAAKRTLKLINEIK